MSYLEKLRQSCRRPIADHEIPGLEALGGALRDIREALCASRTTLGQLASVSIYQLQMIELGARRTRRSTLERISAALVQLGPELEVSAEELTERLCQLAGEGLAPESPYRDRIERRRERRPRLSARRQRRAQEAAETAIPIAEVLAKELLERELKNQARQQLAALRRGVNQIDITPWR
jgi:hypothetical protein